MSICSLCLGDEDLFLNFLSSSYSLVTKSKTKLLKRGAKDASRGAKDASEDGKCMKVQNISMNCDLIHLNYTLVASISFHQWLFQISMKLPLAKIELGPNYNRLRYKFSFSGLKMRLADL